MNELFKVLSGNCCEWQGVGSHIHAPFTWIICISDMFMIMMSSDKETLVRL